MNPNEQIQETIDRAEYDRLAAELAACRKELKDWQDGADAEAFAGDEARGEVAELDSALAAAVRERDEAVRLLHDTARAAEGGGG